MTKFSTSITTLLLAATILLTGCAGSGKLRNHPGNGDISGGTASAVTTQAPAASSSIYTTASSKQTTAAGNGQNKPAVDYATVKPNEAGSIMVVMFHNFVEAYKSGDKEYTTTFNDFRKLLQTLYDADYRLIGMNDYLNHRISVPAGRIPIIFTFDDGASSQFNLIEQDGKLVVNPSSAVGIMEEFTKSHPDFGLKGSFYVYLGNGAFPGKGTQAERLQYLIDKGFDIGNHTLNHINLSQAKSAEQIQKEIAGNQKKMGELIPGYIMKTLSMPYGSPSKDLQQYVAKGAYDGVEYNHLAIMEVGWDPALSPVNPKFNPLSTHRVRASGIGPVEADLAWWLKQLSRGEQYVSDGDADTVAVPSAKANLVDRGRLNGKRLILY